VRNDVTVLGCGVLGGRLEEASCKVQFLEEQQIRTEICHLVAAASWSL
jgi:hypothetical protein